MPAENVNRREAFKQRRRTWEFELITLFIRTHWTCGNTRPRIIEFGCSPATGAQQMSKIGDLVVSDIYQDHRLQLPPGVRFVLCDIQNAPFKDGEFDLIVSNQVIEHIADLDAAFSEIRRMACRDALFAFSVSTAAWLIVSIPGQIWRKAENLHARLAFKRKKVDGNPEGADGPPSGCSASPRWWQKWALHGHGCYPGFGECLVAFRVKRWREGLRARGFTAVKECPLLSYGSSHMSLIPTDRVLARLGRASSYLFLAHAEPQEERVRRVPRSRC